MHDNATDLIASWTGRPGPTHAAALGWAAERAIRDYAVWHCAELRKGAPQASAYRIGNVTADVALGIRPPMPEGVCRCPRCREVWELGETQRAAVDLANTAWRRRHGLRLVRA